MNHRMHDFVQLGMRIFAAVGLAPEQFVGQFDELRRSTGADIAAGDAFVTALQAVIERLAQNAQRGESLPGWKTWFPTGSCAVLGEDGVAVIGVRPRKLVELLASAPQGFGRDYLPRNEREAAGALLRTMPVLSAIGIQSAKREPSKGNAYWEFRRGV